MPVTTVWAWHKKGHNELSESVTGQISKEQIYLLQYKSFNKKCSLKKNNRKNIKNDSKPLWVKIKDR